MSLTFSRTLLVHYISAVLFLKLIFISVLLYEFDYK